MPGPDHLEWGAEALWQALAPVMPGLSVEVLTSCGSTNAVLLDRIRGINPARRHEWHPPGPMPAGPGRRQGDIQPSLLVAEHQTQGRGRQGKTWQSTAGASLTVSLAVALSPTDWSGLSLAVGLALADALDPPRPDHALRLGLKWPNDLLLLDAPDPARPDAAPGRAAGRMGRKLGGILIETVMAGPCRMAVIGVGLNVLPQATDALSWGYGCLQELDDTLSAPATLHRVMAPLARALQGFEQAGFAQFQAGFSGRDVLLGQQVSTTLPGLPEGRADGVDASGTLWLQADGQRLPVASGEVSVRLAPGAARAGPAQADDGRPGNTTGAGYGAC